MTDFEVIGQPTQALPTADLRRTPPAPTIEGDFEVVDTSAPIQQQEAALPGLTRSFFQGLLLNFGDEAESIARNVLAGAGFDVDRMSADEIQASIDRFAEQNPALSLGAEVIGAFALPAGAAARGATMGARALRGAGVGGITGAVAGAGAGEDIPGRVTGAAEGAVAGGLLGLAAPVAVEGVIRGGQRLLGAAERAGAPIRGAVRPEMEAARRVALARQQDIALGQPGLGGRAFTQAQREGLPVTNLELGGDVTRELARSAANQSPEALSMLNRVIDDRFEGQGARLEGFLNSLFPRGRVDSFTRRDQLRARARRLNRPAYDRAFAEGDRSLRSEALDRLLGSPMVVAALGRAATRGRDRAIAEGFGAFNPAVTVTNDGRVRLRAGRAGVPIFPNLRLWDLAKRELDDAANAARRQGRNEEAATFTSLARQLRDELDELVPSYARARGTARSFFNADDALQAGQNFARQSRFSIPEARKAVNRMNSAERELFAEGFVDEMMLNINRTRDRANVIQRIYGNQDTKDRIALALGPQRARQLEARVRVEQLMDRARSAVQGNSTTARQLVELGLVGGGAGALTGFDPTSMIASALVWRGARRLRSRTDERVARRVAELLVSDDPAAVNRAIQQISRNPRILEGLRRFDTAMARVAAQQAAQQSILSGALGMQ